MDPKPETPAKQSVGLAMPRKKLTDLFVKTLEVTDRTEYQDEGVQGLVLRVSANGSKTWTVRYVRQSDGAKQRVTLGRYPAVSLDKARTSALKLMAKVADGDDPAGSKRAAKAAMTVAELAARYIEKHAKPHKRTWQADAGILSRDVLPVIGRMKADAVRKRDILDIVDAKADAGKVAQARLTLACVRKMLNWAVDNDYLATSPATGVKARGKPVRRDRVLSGPEVRSLWQSLPAANLSAVTKDVLRLLLLTGQRSGEVCGMTTGEIDLDRALWTLPAARTKNGLAHTVPLSDAAIEIIKGRVPADAFAVDVPVFAVVGSPIEPNAIAQAVRLKLQIFAVRWTPHDLRRTVATGMAEIGILPHVIEATLNHISGFRSGVAGIYNRNTYDREKRQALERWAAHVDALTSDRSATVIPLKAGA